VQESGNHQFYSFEKINFFCKKTLEIPGIFCDVIPCVWQCHIMHLIYIYTVLTGFLLLLIPQLREIHFETQFYISWNRSKICQDAAMLFASIDRGHSNLSNHVITSISTTLALTGFLHAPLQFNRTPFFVGHVNDLVCRAKIVRSECPLHWGLSWISSCLYKCIRIQGYQIYMKRSVFPSFFSFR
jgi:hypothetical protein